MTASAARLWAQIRTYTAEVTVVEVERRLQAMLDRREAERVNSAMLKHALRNLGKPPNAEVPVGVPSEPLDQGGYPEGRR